MIPAPENKQVVSSEVESTFLLIEQIRAGDKSALDRLLRRFLPLLTRWASGRLPRGVRDLSDTEDLVQETIISALRHIDHIEIRGEGALQAYLRRAVLNRIRDELRRHGRRGLAETLDENVRAKEDSPLEIAIGNEALERYEAALSRLSAGDREAVIARIELGQTYAEIASALGKPSTEAARMAVNRALARLARLMTPA
jgi:RNA polymerase sigma-70 factor (ECF subfamily)